VCDLFFNLYRKDMAGKSHLSYFHWLAKTIDSFIIVHTVQLRDESKRGYLLSEIITHAVADENAVMAVDNADIVDWFNTYFRSPDRQGGLSSYSKQNN
jgi:hypothetical protein